MSQKDFKMPLPEGLTKADVVLYMYRGSHAHGMYVPPTEPTSIDDIDTMGVFIYPIDHYFGLNRMGSKETVEIWEGEWDTVHYEIRKFFNLLIKSNPNVLTMLFLEKEFYLHKSPLGQRILDNRDIFISKFAAKTFSGYAESQLKKMTAFKCEGYMGEKRKRLIQKFGYDTKNAAHLIRLLKMGTEFLQDGYMQVCRIHDKDELLSIKRGEWKLYEVKDYAEELFLLHEKATDLCKLPEEPDYEAANKLLISILNDYHGGTKR